MELAEYFHNIDILEKIIASLEYRDLISLLKVDKQILFLIGHSNVWLRFTNRERINRHYFWTNKYTKLCKALAGNKLVPNTIRSRFYYGEIYYCFRYYHFITYEFDGCLCLYDVMQTSKKNLKRFTKIIDDLSDYLYPLKNGEYMHDIACNDIVCNGARIRNMYRVLIQNIDFIRDLLKNDDENIIKNVILKPLFYNLSGIIINAHNDDKYCFYTIPSSMRYNPHKRLWFAYREPDPYDKYSQFLCEDYKPINKYGDGGDSQIEYDDDIKDQYTYAFFKEMGKRIGVDAYRLYTTCKFIFSIGNEINHVI